MSATDNAMKPTQGVIGVNLYNIRFTMTQMNSLAIDSKIELSYCIPSVEGLAGSNECYRRCMERMVLPTIKISLPVLQQQPYVLVRINI